MRAVFVTIYRIPNMNGLVDEHFVIAFRTVISGGNSLLRFSIPLNWELLLATLLAVTTAVVSNLTLILAIQRIGSTSILGVMEPVTTVCRGHLGVQQAFRQLVAGVLLVRPRWYW